VFNEVAQLYDRVRPGYPDELFADLVTITGIDESSSVLEVGCGTGQATRSLAALGCPVTAVEPGVAMAGLARRRLAACGNVTVETSTFEQWDDHGRRFDVLVAASAWHWIDPSIGWRRAHDVLHPAGWMALLGNVVVRQPPELEVYAETADLHQRFSPGNPGWGHPPLAEDVRRTDEGWALVEGPGELFGPTIVRWYPSVQWLDGQGFADLLGSTSLYRELDRDVREPLLDAIAERIRTRMGDRAPRRYLSVLRAGQREADAFAAEFLTPRASILPHLPRRLNFNVLADLQHTWGSRSTACSTDTARSGYCPTQPPPGPTNGYTPYDATECSPHSPSQDFPANSRSCCNRRSTLPAATA
jgi:SAM-dependent methyltransferase